DASRREGLTPPPAPQTSFVGRESELISIQAALRDPATRILTLTGPGGVGKTRLAIQVAHDLQSAFPGGIAWVDLTPFADPGQVGTAILSSLGIADRPSTSVPERLADLLPDARLLILIDNFEHLMDAASVISGIAAGHHGIAFLITSREPLNLTSERIVTVEPFGSTGLGATGPDPAVELFVTRAQARRASFIPTVRDLETVAAICRRVDGLPLAIELAAARIAHLSPADLLDRLDPRLPMLTGGKRDAPARQQTLRDTIEWSHQMLTQAEKAIFRRLSIFAGGCTIDGAEAVVNAAGDGLATAGGIAALVDKNLLRVLESDGGPLRFAMLETVREFALAQLAGSPDLRSTKEAHAAWFLDLAERASAHHRTAAERAWLDRLESDRANLSTALAWLEHEGDAERFLRLTIALYRFWYYRGPIAEGRTWFDRALDTSADIPPGLKSTALVWSAALARGAGDPEAAVSQLAGALELALGARDEGAIAGTLGLWGIVAMENGETSTAEDLVSASVALARHQPEDSLAGIYRNVSMGCLCLLALNRGDVARAEAVTHEAIALARRRDDPFAIAQHTVNLGAIARERGDLAGATSHYRDALASLAAFGDRNLALPNLLCGIARLGVLRGEPVPAARLLGAAVAMANAVGIAVSPGQGSDLNNATQLLASVLGANQRSHAMSQGHDLGTEGAIDLAHAILDGVATRHAGAPRVLTPRQTDVLHLIAGGLTDREIADRLSLSPRTIQRHVSGIFDAFDVHTRSAAIAHAYRLGVLGHAGLHDDGDYPHWSANDRAQIG
ncbi:MAG TPA: LuxR C-terminal-related transcriptional regulator, partial [Thermomicrobiales bacterium]|nr:LuxR C-terminal-related transcriptional regulator [Thermomicrobiales bacterium]